MGFEKSFFLVRWPEPYVPNDSMVVVHMIQIGVIRSQNLKPMIRELVAMLNSPYWRASVIHVHREANTCAVFFANLGHETDSFFTFVDVIPGDVSSPVSWVL